MAVQIEVNETTIFLYDLTSSKRAHGAIARGADGKTLSVKPKGSLGYIIIAEDMRSHDFAALAHFFTSQAHTLAAEEDRERVLRERKEQEKREEVERVMDYVRELDWDGQEMLVKAVQANLSHRKDT